MQEIDETDGKAEHRLAEQTRMKNASNRGVERSIRLGFYPGKWSDIRDARQETFLHIRVS